MIVAFTGRKRSGKNTAAEGLDYDVQLAFAAPMKNMLHSLLRDQLVSPADIERMVEGDLKETPVPELNGRTPRYAMQTLGTEWGRGLIADSLWVDAVVRLAMQAGQVVITDVRFPNEVQAVKDVGGIVIRITRPGLSTEDAHPSEALIDELLVDYEIANDSTVEELHSKVRCMIDIRQ